MDVILQVYFLNLFMIRYIEYLLSNWSWVLHFPEIFNCISLRKVRRSEICEMSIISSTTDSSFGMNINMACGLQQHMGLTHCGLVILYSIRLWSSLIQLMAWHLTGTKPLSEPNMAYCPLDNFSKILTKMYEFSFKEMYLKMLSENASHFVQESTAYWFDKWRSWNQAGWEFTAHCQALLDFSPCSDNTQQMVVA